MKHKHFMSGLLMAGCVMISFSSCEDERLEQEKQQVQEEMDKWDKIQSVTVSGQVDGYDYVDLGLSTRWATYNVGAAKPTDNGDHFSWGEISPKEEYDIDNYKWFKTEGSRRVVIKYNTEKSDADTIDNKKQLDPEDDAATANWGENWRMPTANELAELVNNCEWKMNFNFGGSGVAGYVGVSKINGNVIFFPAAESLSPIKYDNSVVHRGYYWTSTLGEEVDMYGFYMYFNCDPIYGREFMTIFDHDRSEGRSVRAVTTNSK